MVKNTSDSGTTLPLEIEKKPKRRSFYAKLSICAMPETNIKFKIMLVLYYFVKKKRFQGRTDEIKITV